MIFQLSMDWNKVFHWFGHWDIKTIAMAMEEKIGNMEKRQIMGRQQVPQFLDE